MQFDAMKTAGALPAADSDPMDDDYYDEEDVIDRAAPGSRVQARAEPAVKAVAHCHLCFATTAIGAFVVLAGRVASVFGFVFGLIVLICWAAEARMFDIHFSDWFFWLVWLVHAVALALAFLSRVTARCWRVVAGRNGAAFDVGSTPYKIFTRDPYSSRCEGCIVGTLNFIQAAVVLLSMFVIMQAMLSEGTYLHELKLVWTLAYVCQSVAVWLQILSDCLTLYLVYARRNDSVHCAFLLSSVAGVLACFCIPIFTFGYALYCASCCSGDWGGLIFP